MIAAKGAVLLFTPPYCFDCTPLDNGAFGWVCRYLQKNERYFAGVPLEDALDDAFSRVGRRLARRFFKNCEYA